MEERTSRGRYQLRVVSTRTAALHKRSRAHISRTHGFANTDSNQIPRCNAARMIDYVDKCASNVDAIWIDALCIPGGAPVLRRMAIAQMRRVYAESAVVLVLDARLMKTSSTSKYVRKLELLKSDWRTRLWTLQEGRESVDLPYSQITTNSS